MSKKLKKKNRLKNTFEPVFEINHASEWRKPQGHYLTDIDAHKRLNDFYTKMIRASYLLNFALLLLILIGVFYMTWFNTFEITYLSDGSSLSCVINDDGSTTIVY